VERLQKKALVPALHLVSREVGSVGAFAWHPARENTILAVGWRGFSEWTVSDRLTLNWSARHLVVTNQMFIL
jgi:hypothetical protein